MELTRIIKSRIFLIFLGLLCILTILHLVFYQIDKELILSDKDPKFSIMTGGLKDGGTEFYYGIGYQIIKWNRLGRKLIDGKEIDGMEHEYEIHRFPFFVEWEKGPNIELEFRY